MQDNKIGYVTLDEANTYISSHFLSSDIKRESWEGLSDEDKIVLLNQSLNDIESLKFIGRKTDINQELSFPRNGKTEIPNDVKVAQIEGAISRLSSNTAYDSIQNGITSEKVGNASYTYSTSSEYTKGVRKESLKYLKKYIKQIFSYY